MTAGHAWALAGVAAALWGVAGCGRDDRGVSEPASGPSVGHATARASAVEPGAASPPSAREDRDFIFAAATDGLFELQAAQLAVARATAPDVKALAARVVNDRTNASSDLAQLAAVRGIALPTRLPRDLEARLRRLSQASGATFDREYLRQVGIAADENSIRRLEDAGDAGRDPQLKAWIDRILPMLRQHLSEARKLDAGG